VEETVLGNALSKLNFDNFQFARNEFENGLTLAMINNLIISNHAKQRGKERFNFKNDSEIISTVKDGLKKSKYIGLVPASDGNESHLFAYQDMGIHISKDYKCVNTLVHYRERYLSEVINSYDEIKKAIIDLQYREMKKLSKNRVRMSKKVVLDQLDSNVEIAELERKIYKSKSEKAKAEYNNRKEVLIKSMQEQEENLKEINSKIRKVGGALAYLNK
jgi:alpha-galactosidase/6-phospho-beta-glucosidase family protein